MLRATSTRVALAVCCFSACAVIFLAEYTPPIPNKVTPEEYEIYSQWTVEHFHKGPPQHLYFASRTFDFERMAACGNSLTKDGVRWSMIRAQDALGKTQYPINLPELRIPWEFKGVDSIYDVPEDSYKNYHYVAFSRVAFNNSHTEALFAFSDSCGGLCGKGGPLLARKENGKWTFRNVGCIWIS